MDGDSRSLERSLKELLLCSWEGPIVKFLDEEKQARVERGEKEHIRFWKNNHTWMDTNTRVMLEEGDREGIRMASNQLHYKSLRNRKEIEYQTDVPKRTYAQVVEKESSKEETVEREWTTVENRKKRKKPASKVDNKGTVFIAKIPILAKAKEVWDFFKQQAKFWISSYLERETKTTTG